MGQEDLLELQDQNLASTMRKQQLRALEFWEKNWHIVCPGQDSLHFRIKRLAREPERFIWALSNCRIEVCNAIGMAENQCELSMGMSGDFEQALEFPCLVLRVMNEIFVNLSISQQRQRIVWHVSDAKVIPIWQKQLGDTLAKHVTSCGFKSNL
ncbi:Protein PLASTID TRANSCRIPTIONALLY ACTIVE 14 [Camellia lanceoleosa]|uniref:Protein PLASTID TRANSCRIPTIONALLY ACTIVE 14 n=1 Tax=Camellia lanceoleosa TaxID=1840588 RepID=A0ACC0G1D6_9ERIC|nr:Protein PLASTID TRANSCRIPTIONALLY ACTIVE 14 [Camellia lanceoleosa]